MIETGIPPEWKDQWNNLVEQLHDPLKMRILTLGIVAAIGFLGIYRPMDGQIQSLRREVKASRERLSTIRQVEGLRKVHSALLENLPAGNTLNFWQEYFLSGIRDSGVRLRSLESAPKKMKVGAFQVVYLNIEADGEYAQIHQLMSWIENNKWFIRIIRFRAKGKNDQIESKITVAILVDQEKKAHGV